MIFYPEYNATFQQILTTIAQIWDRLKVTQKAGTFKLKLIQILYI